MIASWLFFFDECFSWRRVLTWKDLKLFLFLLFLVPCLLLFILVLLDYQFHLFPLWSLYFYLLFWWFFLFFLFFFRSFVGLMVTIIAVVVGLFFTLAIAAVVLILTLRIFLVTFLFLLVDLHYDVLRSNEWWCRPLMRGQQMVERVVGLLRRVHFADGLAALYDDGYARHFIHQLARFPSAHRVLVDDTLWEVEEFAFGALQEALDELSVLHLRDLVHLWHPSDRNLALHDSEGNLPSDDFFLEQVLHASGLERPVVAPESLRLLRPLHIGTKLLNNKNN